MVDCFATGFDELPEIIEGLPSARILVATGRLVTRFVGFGLESPDGAVDLGGVPSPV